MSASLEVLIMMLAFFLLLALGLPVAFGLIGLSIVFTLIFVDTRALYAVFGNLYHVLTNEIYIAIPLFVIMGNTLQYSGIASRLYDSMYKWFGGMSGGLAIGTIALCTLIAAMTGLGATGVVTIGPLAYPEMKKRGYSPIISIGCIPAGGSLGPLIPPSVIMIIVGGLASVSVGGLFMGGVFPGLLASFLFMVYIAIRCFRNPTLAPALSVSERASWREKFRSLRGVVLPIAVIFLVLGTVYLGVATPTEAGGIGALGAFICAVLYKQVNLKNIKAIFTASLQATAMIMWMAVGGTAFASILNLTGISSFLGDIIQGMGLNSVGFVIIAMIIVFILGMFLDSISIIMITLPIFVPIVQTLGIDLLWFSLLFTIALVIGLISPPFGMELFYTKGIIPEGIPTKVLYNSVWPFVGLYGLVLVIGIIFPPLLTWLPHMMIK